MGGTNSTVNERELDEIVVDVQGQKKDDHDKLDQQRQESEALSSRHSATEKEEHGNVQPNSNSRYADTSDAIPQTSDGNKPAMSEPISEPTDENKSLEIPDDISKTPDKNKPNKTVEDYSHIIPNMGFRYGVRPGQFANMRSIMESADDETTNNCTRSKVFDVLMIVGFYAAVITFLLVLADRPMEKKMYV